MARGIYVGENCIADLTEDNVTYTSDGKIDTICGRYYRIDDDSYINKIKFSDEDDSVLRFGAADSAKYVKSIDVSSRLAIDALYRQNMNDLIDRFGDGLAGGSTIG